ncbi:LADA_0H12266g1_1 [Lachancea dasiensis]|uniref:LADA_0H12266g1_1 n=1 Tax=Lachancea dasiensis TaxID=1072105 RepID=A0A1G4K3Q8_9SACH|nr:LADA_0H12266g1_1 [Lachancea dasiensis]
MQEIMVPSGGDQCMKLTLVSIFQDITQVQKYLGSLQDTFSVELKSTETITQNLKVKCVSHGSCHDCPLYILEYNSKSHEYALWKSAAGGWTIGATLARLFARAPTSKSKTILNVAELDRHLESSDVSSRHSRNFLRETLQNLNVEWHTSPFDFKVFFKLLDESIDREMASKQAHASTLELVSPLQYKSLITLAVLKTKVLVSKQKLQKDLLEYNQRVQKCQLLATTDDSSTIQAESPEPSLFSATSHPLSSPADDSYSLSSRQLLTNFQKHFKGLAETFETFDVQKSSPRMAHKWKIGKTSKSGKSSSKKLSA